jgi:N-acetylglucosamine-6-phosphate deacetylase
MGGFMTTILAGGRVVLLKTVLERASLVIDARGRIVEIHPGSLPPQPGAAWHDLTGRLVLPGFVDVHVHGVEGIDTLATSDGVAQMARRLPRYGVTGFCPTTVACPPADLRRLLDAIRAARRSPEPDAARVLPAHLESNFINPDFRGAQPLVCLRRPTGERLPGTVAGAPFSGRDILDEIGRATSEVGIVTLAPELDGGLDLVRRLSAAGHLVSLGHSAASYEQGLEGFAAGARHATHLFNRMPPFAHRAPGLVGAVIDCPQARAEVVCDGYHVNPVVARTAIAALGPDRVMAITDGTAGSGLPVGTAVPLGSHTITVGPEAAFLPDGTLAGSTLTMDGAFRMLVQQVGLPITAAARLCATTPAAQLGLTDRGRIEAGQLADLAVLDDELRPVATFLAGVLWKPSAASDPQR